METENLENKVTLNTEVYEAIAVPRLLECFVKDMRHAYGYTNPIHYYKKNLERFDMPLSPSLIEKVNIAMPKLDIEKRYKEEKSNFLSALIQASHEQGFNNFRFEEVNADHFGYKIKGRKDDPIIINAGKIKGSAAFGHAENIVVEIEESVGGHFFEAGRNFVAKIEKLYGDHAFHYSDNFIAEIGEFGYGEVFGLFAFGKVYCQDKPSLEKMKSPWFMGRRIGEGPDCIFAIEKMQDKPLDVYINHVNNKSVYHDCKKEGG